MLKIVLIARSVSAARFGSVTSLPGFRAQSFRFFVVSYSIRFSCSNQNLSLRLLRASSRIIAQR